MTGGAAADTTCHPTQATSPGLARSRSSEPSSRGSPVSSPAGLHFNAEHDQSALFDRGAFSKRVQYAVLDHPCLSARTSDHLTPTRLSDVRGTVTVFGPGRFPSPVFDWPSRRGCDRDDDRPDDDDASRRYPGCDRPGGARLGVFLAAARRGRGQMAFRERRRCGGHRSPAHLPSLTVCEHDEIRAVHPSYCAGCRTSRPRCDGRSMWRPCRGASTPTGALAGMLCVRRRMRFVAGLSREPSASRVGEIAVAPFVSRISTQGSHVSLYFFSRTSCASPRFALSSALDTTMKKMMTTTNTPTFAEAAMVASAPCWHEPVADRRQLGYVLPLAERYAR